MNSSEKDHHYATLQHDSIGIEQTPTVCSRNSDLETTAEKIDIGVFGDEENAAIRYQTMSWPMVAILMIAEIVSNGMLSLPSAIAAVGLVPGVLLIIFLGLFALYTAFILVDFKLNHPEVHNMGDAGRIMGGSILREILSAGTVIFAIAAAGSQLLAGQIALSTLANNRLCLMLATGIFTIPTMMLSFPRTLDQLSWLCIPSCISILIAGIVGMAAAANHPVADRQLVAANSSNFYDAFLAVTNPIFAYAGHFMFFIMISEMKRPADAKKSACVLQGFATVFYVIFGVVMYVYLGPNVASPAFSSLPSKWAKIAYGIAIPNLLVTGSLNSHTAAKLVFVRLFRGSSHINQHTYKGWSTWTILVIVVNGVAFTLAIGVPIFSYFVSIVASLFASWYTYGIVGAFWLFDAYHGMGKGKINGVYGVKAWKGNPTRFIVNTFTFLAGSFMCVAGTYVSVKLIITAYNDGTVGKTFAC